MRWRQLILALAVLIAVATFARADFVYNPSGGGAPSGPAGGDLGGTYPNPTVVSGAHIASGTLPTNALSGWPVTFFQNGLGAGTPFQAGAGNQVYAQGITLNAPVTFSNISVNISTADGTNPSDFGLYTLAGALIAHVGAATYGTTGQKNLALIGGSGAPYTLTPGVYVFAFTSSAHTIALQASSSSYTPFLNGNVGTSASGVLPSTITAQTITPSSVGGAEMALY